MGDPLLSLAALVVTLGVLITVHEFGHFWVARRLGVKVLRFSVGFGRPLWQRRAGADGTEFVVATIPLGGYVRMLDEREGPVPAAERARAFNRQPVGSRIAIVAAGPAFNFLFAIAAYALMFMVGVSGLRPVLGPPVPGSPAAEAGFRNGDEIVAVANAPTPTLNDVMLALLDEGMAGGTVEVEVRDADGRSVLRILRPGEGSDLSRPGQLFTGLGLTPLQPRFPAVIESLQPGGAGEQAGLEPGDRVLAVDGEPVADWQDWAEVVRRHPGQALNVRLERDGVEQTLVITPAAVETAAGAQGRIGAYGRVPPELAEGLRVVVIHGPLAAVSEAMVRTWEMSAFTLRMLGRMVVGKASLENISGPISIAQFAGQSASVGLIPFLSFLALVSISLGVLNLLPIPVLDGGHLLYYLIEMVKGSPLSEAVQAFGQRLGIIGLVLLMGLALFNDLVRLLG